MTDINVFEVDKTESTSNSSVEATIINELVGEGKKFKDVEALAKGKLEADTFIEHLKKEMQELRRDLESKATTEEILRNLKAERDNHEDTSKPQSIARPEEIADIVRKQITEEKAKDIADMNIRKANNTIVTKLGSSEKAVEFVAKKSQELGLSTQRLMQIAAESPEALYGVLGLNDQPTKEQDKAVNLTSDVNTSTFENTQGVGEKGTKAYYDNIRKNNKSLYYSPAIQNEIFKYAKEGKYKA